MDYFTGYAERAPEAAPTTKLDAPNRHALPFSSLSDREFETLAFRLRQHELGDGARVRLMQGTGEKGRDVVVYERGHVVEVIQCKNLRRPVSKPSVVREIMKLALHALRAPSVLGDQPIRYSLWCAAGVSEQAGDLFAEWPVGWTPQAVRAAFTDVVKKYAAFKGLKWTSCQKHLLKHVPQRLMIETVGPEKLSPRLLAAVDIYTSFFTGPVVVTVDEVLKRLPELLAAGGAQSFGDLDARHIMDRVKAFSDDRRIAMTEGYLLGLPKALFAKLNRTEYSAVIKPMIGATINIVNALQDVFARLAEEATKRAAERVKDHLVLCVFDHMLRRSMLAQLDALLLKHLNLRPELSRYRTLSDPQRIDEAVVWAVQAVGKPELAAELLKRVEAAGRQLWPLYHEYMTLLPKDLMVVADASDAMWEGDRFKRVAGDVDETTKLRGSPILPE